jgi:hypothetical protein
MPALGTKSGSHLFLSAKIAAALRFTLSVYNLCSFSCFLGAGEILTLLQCHTRALPWSFILLVQHSRFTLININSARLSTVHKQLMFQIILFHFDVPLSAATFEKQGFIFIHLNS